MSELYVLVCCYVVQSIIQTNPRCGAKSVELRDAVRNESPVVAITNQVDGYCSNDDPTRIDTLAS